MGNEEDIKIVYGKIGTPLNDDTSAIASEIQSESDKGNLQKAKALGEALSSEVTDRFVFSGDDPFELHKTYLAVFSMLFWMEKEISSDITSRTAQNVFFNALSTAYPELTDDIDRSGDFTHYYLVKRNERCTEEDLCGVFADICGDAHNEEYLTAADEIMKNMHQLLAATRTKAKMM